MSDGLDHMSGSVVNIEITDEYVDLTTRFAFWSAIPDYKRATEAEVRASHDNRGTVYENADVERLHHPRCLVATRPPRLNGKFMPCKDAVAEGADRCFRHGGPSARKSPQPKPTKAQLQAEVEALRKQLQEAS